MSVLAHGGVVGLVVEVGGAVALALLMLWALWRGRRAPDEPENDEGRP